MSVETIHQIPVDKIEVPKRFRGLDKERVAGLAASMEEVGLLQPIVVARMKGEYVLVAGNHRRAAALKLGWPRIGARVVKLDDVRRKIAELDENLMRNELTALERSEMLSARKELYEQLHPETKHGGDRKSDAIKGKRVSTRSFAEDTAKKTGTTARAVRQALEPAEKLAPEVKEAIADTPVAESGRQLRELAKEEPETQKAIAEVISEGKADTVAKAKEAIAAKEAADGGEPDQPKRLSVKKRSEALKAAVDEILGPLQKAHEGVAKAMKRIAGVDADLIAGAFPITLAEILGEKLEIEQVEKGTVLAPNLAHESALLKKLTQLLRGKLPHGECPNCKGEAVCLGEECLEPVGVDSCRCGGAGRRCYLCKGLGFITKRGHAELKHNNPRYAG